MIKRCVEQILNLYNFIDGIMVADEEGNIEYYQTFRPDLNDLKMEKIIGKNLFDIYPTLTKENSTIHKVLKTGEPIFNQVQVRGILPGNNQSSDGRSNQGQER